MSKFENYSGNFKIMVLLVALRAICNNTALSSACN
jgi:hypothetical protein